MIEFSSRPKKIVRLILPAIIVLTIAFLYFIDIATAAGDHVMLDSIKPTRKKSEVSIDNLDIASKFYYEITGTASYYARRFHRRLTANGERFNMYAFSAAHKKLPFGTVLRVTNLKNDRSVLVRINDRGPYIKRRILDLSYGAAKEIGGLGLPKVKIEGFHFDENLIPKDADEEYYFGYSFSKDMICLPKSSIEIADSSRNFTEAVKMYKKLSISDYTKDYYLFISAEKRHRRESKKTGYLYFIANVKQNFALNS